MPLHIRCFLLEPVPFFQISFRRFTYATNKPCSGEHRGHGASAIISKVGASLGSRGSGEIPDDKTKEQPGWPKKCERCDYVFQDDDPWQHNHRRVYARTDTGEEMVLNDAPVGAMWFADWFPWAGPDDRCLVVRTPGGDWVVDGPSRNNGKEGPGWERTGDPPNVTVRPSIGMNRVDGKWRYHAFLTNGTLIPCPDSKL